MPEERVQHALLPPRIAVEHLSDQPGPAGCLRRARPSLRPNCRNAQHPSARTPGPRVRAAPPTARPTVRACSRLHWAHMGRRVVQPTTTASVRPSAEVLSMMARRPGAVPHPPSPPDTDSRHLSVDATSDRVDEPREQNTVAHTPMVIRYFVTLFVVPDRPARWIADLRMTDLECSPCSGSARSSSGCNPIGPKPDPRVATPWSGTEPGT